MPPLKLRFFLVHKGLYFKHVFCLVDDIAHVSKTLPWITNRIKEAITLLIQSSHRRLH